MKNNIKNITTNKILSTYTEYKILCNQLQFLCQWLSSLFVGFLWGGGCVLVFWVFFFLGGEGGGGGVPTQYSV